MNLRNKLLIICGPTATGKTGLGVYLAKKFNGELISADSRQVYRGMDIGTGKDLPSNSILNTKDLKLKNYQIGYYLFDKVPVWMLDVVEPNFRFTVADYVRCTQAVLNDVWRRGKLPILVGGTGFYLKALIDGIGSLGVEPDWKLREELQDCEVSELQRKLKELNPERWEKMNESDRQNPRRLIRAIEIGVKSKGKGVKSWERKFYSNTLMIGLKAANKILYKRIDERVDRRMKEGMLEEVERLLNQGISHQKLQDFGLEYRWIDNFLQKKLAKEEMTQGLKNQIHDYTRRQLTWFRKDGRVVWFDISEKGFEKKIVNKVRQWYSSD